MMNDMDPDTDEIMKLVKKKEDLEDKLYGESININGKKYRPIKESKKSKKHILKENYERFFGDR